MPIRGETNRPKVHLECKPCQVYRRNLRQFAFRSELVIDAVPRSLARTIVRKSRRCRSRFHMRSPHVGDGGCSTGFFDAQSSRTGMVGQP